MAPPKKKVPTKKRVLDLKDKSDNLKGSKSPWLSKYQELLPEEGQNGSADGIESASASQLGGLVGDYSSDTDEDSQEPMDSKIKIFLEEIDHIDPVAPPSKPSALHNNGTTSSYSTTNNWVQYLDEGTSYPYYWNQVTNEVTWQMPVEYAAAYRNMLLPTPSVPVAKITPAPKKVVRKKVEAKKKKISRWEGNSDSEEEKIEMITSFETQEKSTKKKTRSRTKKSTHEEATLVGPQLPPGAEDHQYETSSLMTLLVPDEGPPGVEPLNEDVPCKSVPESIIENTESNGAVIDTCNDEDNLTNDATISREYSPLPVNSIDTDSMDTRMTDDKNDCELADAILAEIDKEMPPDFEEPKVDKKELNKAPASFALIASYGDDSDVEEVEEESEVVKEEVPQESKRPCLFPSVAQTSASEYKPLFPSVAQSSTSDQTMPSVVEIEEKVPQIVEVPADERPVVASTSSSFNPLLDGNPPDSTTLKAFKRKKRIEFVGKKKTVEPSLGPPVARPKSDVAAFITNRSEPVADFGPVSETNPRYNMDPTSGEHRGFGFSTMGPPTVADKKSKKVQFVKAETLTFQPPAEAQKNTNESTSSVPAQDLLDGAALLKEKLEFLGEGSQEVSVVQRIAIQLEILVSAWQSGALTPTYLCQWLGSRAVEISKNEEAAAPEGWICEWERESKRYRYRKLTDGTIRWEFPEPEDIEDDEEVAMELSVTPPRVSPSRNDPVLSSAEIVPPPPPVISRSHTPPPPSPPRITCPAPPAPKLFDEPVTSTSEDLVPPPPLPPGPYPPSPPDEPPPPGVDDLDVPYHRHVLVTVSRRNDTPTPSVFYRSPKVSPDVDSTTAEVATSVPNGNKRCLNSELDSFYMDIAKLDSTEPACNGGIEPDDVHAADVSSPSASSSRKPAAPLPQSNTTDEPSAKKRKKGKLGAGLTLKKKGVSNLVAKWQQVRAEARRNNSSDEEDDDVTSTK